MACVGTISCRPSFFTSAIARIAGAALVLQLLGAAGLPNRSAKHGQASQVIERRPPRRKVLPRWTQKNFFYLFDVQRSKVRRFV